MYKMITHPLKKPIKRCINCRILCLFQKQSIFLFAKGHICFDKRIMLCPYRFLFRGVRGDLFLFLKKKVSPIKTLCRYPQALSMKAR